MPFTIRILLALLCLIVAAGLAWYLRRISATGVARRETDAGFDMGTLKRSENPKRFARYIVQLWFLVGL
ncbi:MAG TPA: hypothetical protein PK402_11025, partial [Tepidisphaeraceae bacterium]|nr:hypothetical protein [Tepidisphaeraceae bacterium]